MPLQTCSGINSQKITILIVVEESNKQTKTRTHHYQKKMKVSKCEDLFNFSLAVKVNHHTKKTVLTSRAAAGGSYTQVRQRRGRILNQNKKFISSITKSFQRDWPYRPDFFYLGEDVLTVKEVRCKVDSVEDTVDQYFNSCEVFLSQHKIDQ